MSRSCSALVPLSRYPVVITYRVSWYVPITFSSLASINSFACSYRNPVDIHAIKRRLVRIDGTCVKKGQTSPYAYLPYYLPHIAPGLERIIYLDTDVVVRTDITELADMPMHGFPLAAVRSL
jgi:lipopolysaccharide biosynthesis glycosyltransferase